MNSTQQQVNTDGTYYKIIALWAVCEAFAGGMLHAVKLPFTGMVLSSLSVMCIVLIGHAAPGKGTIIKATIIVCIFKMMLSPHSPPTAYIAVGFQGLLGQILFRKSIYRTGAAILGVAALVESSIQKTLVMWLIYGSSFWQAVNAFLKKTFSSDSSINYLLTLAGLYVLLHAVAGFIFGIYALQLARKSDTWRSMHPELIINEVTEADGDRKKTKRHGFFKLAGMAGWILLLLLYIQSKINPQEAILTTGKITDVLIRAILILLTWYLVLAPAVNYAIKEWLGRQKTKRKKDIETVMALIPHMRYVFLQSIIRSGKERGTARIKLFFKILSINIR